MNVYYLPAPGVDPTARLAALGASAWPTDGSVSLPAAQLPAVMLWSPAVGYYSLYHDDGTLTAAAWANDSLFARETAATNSAALVAKGVQALTVNQTFLGTVFTFPLTSAEQQALVTQVQALTRQVDALIRVSMNQLTSTAGT